MVILLLAASLIQAEGARRRPKAAHSS